METLDKKRTAKGAQCCKFHNRIHVSGIKSTECATTGNGAPTVCCRDCPSVDHYSLPYYFIDDLNTEE